MEITINSDELVGYSTVGITVNSDELVGYLIVGITVNSDKMYEDRRYEILTNFKFDLTKHIIFYRL